MIIGLLGFKFDNENMGCVALTYSVISILIDLFPDDLEIINFTDSVENLEIARDFFPDVKLSGVRYHLTSRLTLKERQVAKILKTCDAVLDITYGDNFSDIYLPKFVHRTTRMKLNVEKLGVPLILMPQTIGPFESKTLKKEAIRAIKKSKRVYTRDVPSKDFVYESLPKKDIFIATDLAFALPYKKERDRNEKRKIGLNVSGLLWKGGFSNENQFGLTVDYKEYINSLIDTLYDQGQNEIHIIPHVVDSSSKARDGDLQVSKELKETYPQVILAPQFLNPIVAKNYIATMDVFTGARMHSTIAAFSSGVATIPFAYSRKFEGLYHNIGYPYIIDGKTMQTEQAVAKTLEYISKSEELHKAGLESMKSVNDKLRNFKADLKTELTKR